MSKKLAFLPLFLGFSALACGNSAVNHAGSAGMAGAPGGSPGSGGASPSGDAGNSTSAGMSSIGGTSGAEAGASANPAGGAGAGGASIMSPAGVAGGDATVGGAAGAAGSQNTGGAGAIPPCPATTSQAEKLDPVVFCKNLLHTCKLIRGFTLPAAYDTEEKCEAAWTANTTAVSCRSYHLCSATKSDPPTHCPFVFGLKGQCAM